MMRTWSESRWVRWVAASLAIAVSTSVAITAEESESKDAKSKATVKSASDAKPAGKKREEFTTGSSDVLISFINEQIRQGWTDNEIEPSEIAGDGEWNGAGRVAPAEVGSESRPAGKPIAPGDTKQLTPSRGAINHLARAA